MFVAVFLAGGLLTSCETTDSNARDKKLPAGATLYHGLSFDIMVPAGMRTNKKQTPQEVVHYFFTPEMAQRKIGMGIYEGVQAQSVVRNRKDLIPEESIPIEIDRFTGSVQSGSTIRGKRWKEFFLFPKDGDFGLQIWFFDVEPEDEALFLNMLTTLKATFKSKE